MRRAYTIGAPSTCHESEVLYIRKKLDGEVLPATVFPEHADHGQAYCSMLNDRWEVMTEYSHSGNSRGFRPLPNAIPSRFRFEKLADFGCGKRALTTAGRP